MSATESQLQVKTFDRPDEVRPFKDHGETRVVHLGDTAAGLGTFEAGWRWSDDVKPIAGTDSCQAHHSLSCSRAVCMWSWTTDRVRGGTGRCRDHPRRPRRLDGRRRALRGGRFHRCGEVREASVAPRFQRSPASADNVAVARLTMTQAVERLSTAAVTVTDEQGNGLELSPVESSGTRLIATADRMRTGERGLLTARVHGDDLRPWVVGFEVESAEYHTDELARVTLRARSIKLDARQRQADRTAMGGHARLIAYSCQNVVDGDVVEGSIVDVSDNGVAFMTRRLLRPGDRLSFAGRFFATVVEAEVRVARIAEVAGQLQVGCTFIAIDQAERKKLRAVTAVRQPGEAASFNVLQQLNAERASHEQEQGGRWRRLFRRSA